MKRFQRQCVCGVISLFLIACGDTSDTESMVQPVSDAAIVLDSGNVEDAQSMDRSDSTMAADAAEMTAMVDMSVPFNRCLDSGTSRCDIACQWLVDCLSEHAECSEAATDSRASVEGACLTFCESGQEAPAFICSANTCDQGVEWALDVSVNLARACTPDGGMAGAGGEGGMGGAGGESGMAGAGGDGGMAGEAGMGGMAGMGGDGGMAGAGGDGGMGGEAGMGGMGGDGGMAGAPLLPYTQDEVQVLLGGNGNGAGGRCSPCHTTGNTYPSINDLGALVGLNSNQGNVAQITPGNAEASYLWLKMAGRQGDANGRGARMPRNGAPLSAEELERIALWINALADD